MNGYTWALKLNDLVSGPAQRLGARYRQVFDRIGLRNRQFQSENRQNARSLDGVRTGMSQLDRTKSRLKVDATEVEQAQQKVNRLRDSLGRFAKGGGGGAGGTGASAAGGAGGGWMNGMLGGIGRRMLPALAAGALLGGAGKVAGQVMDREQLKLQYSIFTKSQAKGDALYGKLNKYADVTPFTNDEVLGAGRNLLAMGFSAERVMPLLGKLGNVAAGLKIPFTELTGVFGKMSQKGFADTSDLYQFTDRGIPIMEYLGKVLKKSNAELFKMAENKQLKFEYLEQAFDRMSGKGGLFSGMLEKMSATLGGKWSTVMGQAQTELTNFGDSFTPVLSKGLSFLQGLLDNAKPLREAFGELGTSVSGLMDEFGRFDTATSGTFGPKGLMESAASHVREFAGVFDALRRHVELLLWPVEKLKQGFDWLTNSEAWAGRMAQLRTLSNPMNWGDDLGNRMEKQGARARDKYRDSIAPYQMPSGVDKLLLPGLLNPMGAKKPFPFLKTPGAGFDRFLPDGAWGGRAGSGGGGLAKSSGLSEVVGAAKSQTINVTIQTLKAADSITLRRDEGMVESELEAKFQDMLMRLFAGIARIPAT